MNPTPDPIDSYLDELLSRLSGPSSSVRRILTEAEAHLRDAADAGIAADADPLEAQRAAIHRFGSARDVALASNSAAGPAGFGALAGALAGPAGRMVAVGFAAVGVSAVLARVVAWWTSTNFVFGLPAGAAVTAARCAHWLAVQPGAVTCSQAAADENADDTLLLYGGFAILGLVALGLISVAVVGIRRLRRGPERLVSLPPAVVPAIGATIFGGAGVALLAAGVLNTASTGLWGQGLWYVEAALSLGVAAVYLVRFVQALRWSTEGRQAV